MDRITAAEVFVQIAERGSLAAAAAHLDMSRAMVSRYLAQMESWAGARLLHRTTRRLSLSPAGEDTLARCRQLLTLTADMPVTDASGAQPIQGQLRIACSQTLAQLLLPELVQRFLSAHPRVSVDLRIDGRPVNLVEERIDMAIRISNDLEPNLIARRLGRCDSLLCAAPQYLAQHGQPRTPEDLRHHACLSYNYFGQNLWTFSGPKGETLEVPVQGRLSANESQVLLAAAVAGSGISMQPVFAAAPLIEQGLLTAVLPTYRPQALGIHAVFASHRHMSAALRAWLDLLAADFEGLAGERSQAGVGVQRGERARRGPATR